jgi:hypothetical protein
MWVLTFLALVYVGTALLIVPLLVYRLDRAESGIAALEKTR